MVRSSSLPMILMRITNRQKTEVYWLHSKAKVSWFTLKMERRSSETRSSNTVKNVFLPTIIWHVWGKILLLSTISKLSSSVVIGNRFSLLNTHSLAIGLVILVVMWARERKMEHQGNVYRRRKWRCWRSWTSSTAFWLGIILWRRSMTGVHAGMRLEWMEEARSMRNNPDNFMRLFYYFYKQNEYLKEISELNISDQNKFSLLLNSEKNIQIGNWQSSFQFFFYQMHLQVSCRKASSILWLWCN